MAVNKVVAGDEVLVDLTDATVTAADLLTGVTAYGASGEIVEGTLGDFDGTAHGLVPESDGSSTSFLCGDGSWSTPQGVTTIGDVVEVVNPGTSITVSAANSSFNAVTTTVEPGTYLFTASVYNYNLFSKTIRAYIRSDTTDTIYGMGSAVGNSSAGPYMGATAIFALTQQETIGLMVNCNSTGTLNINFSYIKLK